MDFGLIGEHLGHSFSKLIHEEISGIPYELKEIPKEDLDAFMREKPFRAINVTIPYKEAVIPYLDDLSPLAKRIGAVNCIVNDNGLLKGYNTDVLGLLAEIRHMGLSIKGKPSAVLGDGGASKAARAALEEEGANPIYVVSRKGALGTISYEELSAHKEIRIIINATSVGMFPKNEDRLIDPASFSNLEGFIDLIYNPLRTQMVLSAQEKGVKAEGGLYMLVAQAVKASEIFLDKPYPVETIEEEYNKLLNSRHNIVLIGMPGSGKTTIGSIVARELSLPFVDLDQEIIKDIKMPIADYFASFGEEAFREKETEAIKRLYQSSPMVISTGGGAILKEENVRLLKQNGTLYFLDRRLGLLMGISDDRPLSKDSKSLQNLYNFRLPLYRKAADKVIKNNKGKNEAIKAILEEERR